MGDVPSLHYAAGEVTAVLALHGEVFGAGEGGLEGWWIVSIRVSCGMLRGLVDCFWDGSLESGVIKDARCAAESKEARTYCGFHR